jgi:GNAT superfamily N-acetyltransferase
MEANPPILRKAEPADLHLLVNMMTEFYAESPYTLNTRRAAEAFAPLLADERLGSVWLIQAANSKEAGYIVLTFSYSMEYGGPIAVVDDFFVRPAFRGVGLGKAALAEAMSLCATRGIRAVNVETGGDNLRALAVYRSAGFTDTHRVHLTLKLAEPTHAA